MSKLILGIETSCDETSAAIVTDAGRVLSNVVSSQVDLHAHYGGIVPEIASRAHIEQVEPVIAESLVQAQVDYAQISAIAVADGPGLVGSLLVGVTAAKTLALALDVPLIPVDHLEAHAWSAALIAEDEPWPAIGLVVSGGHTSIYRVSGPGQLELLGQTIDDAAGEAFDKVAAILELGYPGGPVIDRVAQNGNPKAIPFPRTFMNDPNYDFSFSGIKTAVLYHVYGHGRKYGSVAHLSDQELADIAASFQAAVVEPLVVKTVRAAKAEGVHTVVVGGGVAANRRLRQELQSACDQAGLQLLLTPMAYCTDNAAMIAGLGAKLWQMGRIGDLSLEPSGGLRRKLETRKN
jgi:N6-L-threonylcarbamoyladenine synthase